MLHLSYLILRWNEEEAALPKISAYLSLKHCSHRFRWGPSIERNNIHAQTPPIKTHSHAYVSENSTTFFTHPYMCPKRQTILLKTRACFCPFKSPHFYPKKPVFRREMLSEKVNDLSHKSSNHEDLFLKSHTHLHRCPKTQTILLKTWACFYPFKIPHFAQKVLFSGDRGFRETQTIIHPNQLEMKICSFSQK